VGLEPFSLSAILKRVSSSSAEGQCRDLGAGGARQKLLTFTPIITMAPTMLHVGVIQDHQAGYVRRALRSKTLLITAPETLEDHIVQQFE
jgi:hypothetical protein